jgi:hypothetical protein
MGRKKNQEAPLSAVTVKNQIGQYVEEQRMRAKPLERVYSGQPCPQPGCDGVLHVESTRVIGSYRRRYLKCSKCRTAPENHVQLVPLEFAPRRSPRQNRIFGLPIYASRLAE